MTPERAVALAVGIMAIAFGLMLMPYANALRRRMLKSREPPPVEVTVLGGHRSGRAHVLPVLFFVAGAVLVLLGLFGDPA
jgi:hypothetical protein